MQLNRPSFPAFAKVGRKCNTLHMKRIFNIQKLKPRRQDLRNGATPQEVILWSRLKRSQLGCKFRRQHSIGGYIADFYCAERKLVIEVDGWQHTEQEEYDSERTRYFESIDLTVLRFWNNEVNENLAGVILKIEGELG